MGVNSAFKGLRRLGLTRSYRGPVLQERHTELVLYYDNQAVSQDSKHVFGLPFTVSMYGKFR